MTYFKGFKKWCISQKIDSYVKNRLTRSGLVPSLHGALLFYNYKRLGLLRYSLNNGNNYANHGAFFIPAGN